MLRLHRSVIAPGTCSAILSVLLSLVTGCSSDPSAPVSGSVLLPLAQGTEWKYVRSDSVELGPPPGLQPEHFTVRVIADTTIDRAKWSVLANAQLLFHDSYEGRWYYRNGRDGLYETTPPLDFLPRVSLPPLRVFKYPARRGEQVSTFPPAVVTSTDTLIRVPAGEFRTIRYDIGDYTTYFVAPGTGVVSKVTGLTEMRDATGRLVGRWRTVYSLESITRP